MAGRQAHGGQPSKAPKVKAKVKKSRALNAFAIAQQEVPDKPKIKYGRLGDAEGGSRPGKGKRHRDEDDDEDEEDEDQPRKKTKAPKDKFDEIDVDEGSDSEGNEWKMGEVDSDDDSDLDSDEAFGESDEEKFDGYAFSGSSTNQKKKGAKGKKARDVNLDEDSESEAQNSDEESIGDFEDAIDLATMLDQTADDSEDDVDEPEEASGSGEDMESGSDEESQSSQDEDEDSDDPDKVLALQNLIKNLPQNDSSAQTAVKQRHDGASEYAKASEFGITAKNKLTLEDLGLPNVQDKFVKKSLKLLASEAKSESGKNGVVSGRLAVPLAKRQQDKLDRGAAYDKAKETLDRWKDTVKHNRRAEHLMFPLPDADHDSMTTNTKLQPTTNAKPFNELEATIQSILEESGLATVNGRTDEDKIAEYEELETKKMSLEEVKARRDQLRMARELMFREEARAKRIKKIKSKSYRRVHRKEREREERKNQEALLEAGIEPSEDELEAQDRRRAEERMGSKHRGSKWAKSVKDSGRAAWDEDARTGVNEMLIRDEELRKRVEGRSSRRGGAGSDVDYSESDEYDSDDNEDLNEAQLLKKLAAADKGKSLQESGVGARLANMKFMLKADAARKAENDNTVEQMRRELVGEDSESEQEDREVGRRTFGPGSKIELEMPGARNTKKNEFEEPAGSDDEFEGFDNEVPQQKAKEASPPPKSRNNNKRNPLSNAGSKPAAAKEAASAWGSTEPDHEAGAWTTVKSSKDRDAKDMSDLRRKKADRKSNVDELDLTDAAMIAAPFKTAKSKPKAKKSGGMTELKVSEDDDSDDEAGSSLPFAVRDQKLIARAFAGADVVGEFEAEKRAVAEDEDEKVVDNTLPGWGSWAGDGLSKKARARNKGRFLTKTDGIMAANRKDAKLDKVIINEKKVKKNTKYLASSLPHPFETRAQYERSLRLPVGPEWSTKETFQDATKPRILLKQGIIAPMSKPLV